MSRMFSVVAKEAVLGIVVLTFARSGLCQNNNYALQFDGVNDFLFVSNSPSLMSGNDLTVEFWIKTTQNGFQPLWHDNPFILDKDVIAPGKPDWAVVIQNNSIVWETGYPPWGDLPKIGRIIINDGKWHHVALTRVGMTDDEMMGIKIIYVDGLIDSKSPHLRAPSLSNTDNLYIGCEYNTMLSDFFLGELDEIRIWNTVRTKEQIQEFMMAALPEKERLGLVAYWTFDEAEGQTAYDISGNENHARLGNLENPDSSDPQWIEGIKLLPPPNQPPQITHTSITQAQKGKEILFSFEVTDDQNQIQSIAIYTRLVGEIRCTPCQDSNIG